MSRMSTKHISRKCAQRTGALLVACLLLFSGVANAYCSIDDESVQSGFGAALASSAASAPLSQHGAPDDVCTGVADPDQQDTKPCAQWDGVAGTLILLRRVSPPAPLLAIGTARLAPIAEPVFQRFPRLLI